MIHFKCLELSLVGDGDKKKKFAFLPATVDAESWICGPWCFHGREPPLSLFMGTRPGDEIPKVLRPRPSLRSDRVPWWSTASPGALGLSGSSGRWCGLPGCTWRRPSGRCPSPGLSTIQAEFGVVSVSLRALGTSAGHAGSRHVLLVVTRAGRAHGCGHAPSLASALASPDPPFARPHCPSLLPSRDVLPGSLA